MFVANEFEISSSVNRQNGMALCWCAALLMRSVIGPKMLMRLWANKCGNEVGCEVS
jgi:hypothetical protein